MNALFAFLLHHANRDYKSEKFYAIKNMMLKKYGEYVGDDVQFIEGKKCYTCGGTGVYTGYYWSSGEAWHDSCNRCCGGWYKLPQWNILHRIKFGPYIFHQPFKRVYTEPDTIIINKIDGYVSHTSTRYSRISRHILFLIYESGYLNRYYRELNSWYCSWWMPRNWLHNAIYIHKYGLPDTTFRQIKKWWNRRGYVPDVVYDYDFFVGRKNTEIEDCETLPF